MEANIARFASVLLLFVVVTMFVSASANSGYGKPELEGYVPPKGDTPKEQTSYEKLKPKMPTKSVIPKREHVAYEKTYPKMPSTPVMSKEEHMSYETSNQKLPTKPMIPKEEHGAYEKGIPKSPTKPVVPKEKYEAYKKNDPKVPTKPVIPKGEHDTNGKSDPKLPTKPITPKPENPSLPKVLEHPKNLAVQGLIYCKYGYKLIPLQGATTKVTCLAVRKNGYESTSFSFSSYPANENGYFLAKIVSSKILKDNEWEITECKAFLENSPWTSCKVPEDTNGGITGVRLTFSRHLNRDGYCLSSIGPFIYNPGHESLPKEVANPEIFFLGDGDLYHLNTSETGAKRGEIYQNYFEIYEIYQNT